MPSFPRMPRRRKSCERCHKAKVRCDSDKPSCGRCQKRGVECSYSVSRHPYERRTGLFAVETKSNESSGSDSSSCVSGSTGIAASNQSCASSSPNSLNLSNGSSTSPSTPDSLGGSGGSDSTMADSLRFWDQWPTPAPLFSAGDFAVDPFDVNPGAPTSTVQRTPMGETDRSESLASFPTTTTDTTTTTWPSIETSPASPEGPGDSGTNLGGEEGRIDRSIATLTASMDLIREKFDAIDPRTQPASFPHAGYILVPVTSRAGISPASGTCHAEPEFRRSVSDLERTVTQLREDMSMIKAVTLAMG